MRLFVPLAIAVSALGLAAWDQVGSAVAALPIASAETLEVGSALLDPSLARESWTRVLLDDQKGGGVQYTTVVSVAAFEEDFCSVSNTGGGTSSCHGGGGTNFFSIHANSVGLSFCSALGDASGGTTTCHSTGTSGGLTMSCSKDAASHPGNVCTSGGDANSTGSTFCGITTTGICSTWQTNGSQGTQRCSTFGGNATIKCTAMAGASGWCSVDSTQESNVQCTSFGGGVCSTIGGGSGNCSTLVSDGQTPPTYTVNPPSPGGTCTVP